MNLHISTASTHIYSFQGHLSGLGLTNNNKIVLRTETQDSRLPGAKLYTKDFDALVGNTAQYDQVFIHQFSPMLYRWVAQHDFKKLNWMVWGADLYNLPGHEFDLFEPLTKSFVKKHQQTNDILYQLKARAANWIYQKRALSKVDHILTWMDSEFQWAKENLPVDHATHKHFFYQNKFSYESVQSVSKDFEIKKNQNPVLVLGNSGTPSNNHLDMIDRIEASGFKGELICPLSYGSDVYIRKIKSALEIPGCKVTFLDQYMPFETYLRMLAGTDGLIMNTLRPQGYGNIFMMMVLGKKVFLNPLNPSNKDLTRMNLHFYTLDEIGNYSSEGSDANEPQAQQVLNYFSTTQMQQVYNGLFA